MVAAEEVMPLAWDLVQEPHRVSALLRESGRVRKVRLPRGLEVWLVTGYAEARAVLADPRMAKDTREVQRLFERDGFESAGDSAVRALTGHMLNSDPPDHTRLRKLVNQAFTSRTVSRLRPRIEQITAELLADIGDAERVDLLPSFAVPLPIRVICELLGVHAGDQPAFAKWSNTMLAWSTPEELRAAAAKMHAYLVDLIEEKRAKPAEDLLSGLIHASDEGDSLSGEELLSMAFLLLVAGFETTVNLIANSVLALLREPEQLAALRADPALLPGAVEEFLRYDGAIHLATIRFTRESVLIGDVEIPADEFVLVSLIG
ncbi:cytochrome P450 family protein, partial [Amycolatopsis thailandensis]|uniref:cytochrome P450 family protein n=1 Tax=Amycolatopsis thailandensis TaxID=589330 RepID=UPI00363D0D53